MSALSHGAARVRLDFDRGTLVLRGQDGADLPEDLPGTLFDARVGVYRAPAHRYAELLLALRRRRLEAEDAVRPPRLPSVAPFAAVELRPYQREALTAWELRGERGLVVLPTGSGKTRVAVAAMAAARVPTLCLVPTRVLVHQWRHELARHYRGPIGCWGDGERRTEAVTVATFESAYRHMPRLGASFDLLVVDEVHHFGAAQRDEALEMSIAQKRLGLTATLPEHAAQLAGLERLIGPCVHRLQVGDLAGTYLADFDLIVVRLALSEPERREYERELAVFRPVQRAFHRACPGASWAELVAATARSPEGRTAMAAWRRSRSIVAFHAAKRQALAHLLGRHRGARLLVFTADNAAAYAIAREHLIMPLTCDIKRKERDEALARFRRGELKALVSSRVLNEGLDVPDAEVAIVVAGTLGEREHVQRVGRLLRPVAGKRAIIYELVTSDTSERQAADRRRRGLGLVRPLQPR